MVKLQRFLFVQLRRDCMGEFIDLLYLNLLTLFFQPEDPCKRLRCRMPGKWDYVSESKGSPALEGTKCGDNKVCILKKFG